MCSRRRAFTYRERGHTIYGHGDDRWMDARRISQMAGASRASVSAGSRRRIELRRHLAALSQVAIGQETRFH